jgi:hypothetical protein
LSGVEIERRRGHEAVGREGSSASLQVSDGVRERWSLSRSLGYRGRLRRPACWPERRRTPC